MKEKLQLIPIGGLGEVGMNHMLFQTSQFTFLFDCGTASSHSPWLGFDSVFPDYKKIFDEEIRWPEEIVISHGHEDHIGALPYFLAATPKKVKIHATAFTAELIRKKMKEHGYAAMFELVEHKQKEEFAVGPFKIKYFFNNHSIFDSNCLSIRLNDYHIFHTGDFRIDSGEFKDPVFSPAKIKDTIGNVDLLLSDSTNSEREGKSLGEVAIGDNFKKIMDKTTGACLFTCFASNVRRLQHIVETAIAKEKKLIFLGRSMEKFVDMAQQFDIFQIPSVNRADWEKIGSYPKKDLVILMTGSQGEHQAALSRMAHGQIRDFQLSDGDSLVFSALQIPGNESKIRYLLNQFSDLGVRVYKNSPSQILHTTGHAYEGELKEVLQSIKPKALLPVHGDITMLKAHANIAKEMGMDQYVIKNMSALEIEEGQLSLHSFAEELPLCWAKREFTGSVDDVSMREKKRVGRDGMIHFTYSPKSVFEGELVLNLDCIGCHYVDLEYDSGKNISERIATEFFKSFNAGELPNEWFRRWIRNYFRKKYGMRPYIKIIEI